MATMIVGLGPAGLAALTAMYTDGILQHVCDNDLYLVDSNAVVGAGEIIRYNVRSDSAGAVFAQCVQPLVAYLGESTALDHVLALPPGETVDLSIAGQLLQDAAVGMLDIAHDMGAHVRLSTTVETVQPETRGAFVTMTGLYGVEAVHIDHLLLCVGGQPYIPSSIVKHRLWRKAPVMHSDVVLHETGLHQTLQSLPKDPKILIIGRAHSAFSAADRLLTAPTSQDWSTGSVTLAARGPIRVTYNTVADALADGAKVGPEDICPKTGKVFRLCGLRNDSARRYFQARDGLDTRLIVRQVPTEVELHARMTQADLVIAATGFRTKATYFIHGSKVHPDGTMTRNGRTFEGIRAMGLGCGTLRSEASGGEASYNGPVDGVWHYQAIVAPPLLHSLAADLYTLEARKA